ncbi:RagB/SusD family nutrient uptake outer membrane protein [Mucilaginibacter roseus]|uniref:RagB/SusD family nutrient uptake outer membrane protein n=1 Tax=Mucilaginibacter roseus TaxID=1528868 RepID=A0ABS8U4M7_9SPHI|nr:RagB/SusD family nutrient uptake outer membrane protein [Mucilaginibacter roseus]MCD8741030.1 RagB/SusD family nutrient uptake outer membrane protein [Mucilaginibacter roseus]
MKTIKNKTYRFKAAGINLTVLCIVALLSGSCKKYLDIVPDNVATIDNAFTLRNEAEKFLFTCYSYLPKDGNPLYNAGYMTGDEVWTSLEEREFIAYGWRAARGGQNAAEPYMDAWNGRYSGGGPGDNYGLYKAIRNCNIFIENVQDLSKVPDLTIDERQRWLAEVKFLKAYYNFYLMRMYGPIPIVDKNLEISAPEGEVRIKRQPFDNCVDYAVNLIDEALPNLPTIITDRTTELGRITKPIALAVKAKLLLMAASPLFNGNPDYADFKDKDGVNLFNPAYDQSKWQKAADAAKAAIDASEAAGFKLYQFPGTTFKLSDTTLRQLTIKGAVTERFGLNLEHVWANPNSRTFELQRFAMPRLTADVVVGSARQQLAPPIKIAEMFYSRNGVPITEDKTLDFTNRYSLRTATKSERFYIKEGFTTARINFDREPRFYADLGFDGGIWYKYDSPTNSDEGTFVLEAKSTDIAGANNFGWYNETGYFIKKVVDWNMINGKNGATYREYPWPEIRLADIYLMYAEALNETLAAPNADVFNYVNRIRTRAGLPSVQDSWTNFSTNPTKYLSKDGMREIIQRERMIELAFEGSRYWDILRWKRASELMNQPITGWSVYQSTTADYYRVRTIFSQNFVAPRDYLWPIRTYDITINPNLVQNPGW